MCSKPTMRELEESTPENWETLFKKAHQSELIQLRLLHQVRSPVRSRAEVELERRKMNLERFAIIISVSSLLISTLAFIISIYK